MLAGRQRQPRPVMLRVLVALFVLIAAAVDVAADRVEIDSSVCRSYSCLPARACSATVCLKMALLFAFCFSCLLTPALLFKSSSPSARRFVKCS